MRKLLIFQYGLTEKKWYILQLLPSGCGTYLSTGLLSRTGSVTCFGQCWCLSKPEEKRRLEKCTSGLNLLLLHLESWGHNLKTLKLVCWTDHKEKKIHPGLLVNSAVPQTGDWTILHQPAPNELARKRKTSNSQKP